MHLENINLDNQIHSKGFGLFKSGQLPSQPYNCNPMERYNISSSSKRSMLLWWQH